MAEEEKKKSRGIVFVRICIAQSYTLQKEMCYFLYKRHAKKDECAAIVVVVVIVVSDGDGFGSSDFVCSISKWRHIFFGRKQDAGKTTEYK